MHEYFTNLKSKKYHIILTLLYIYIQAPIIPEILAFHRINIFLKSLVFFFLIISNERMIFYSGMHILPLWNALHYNNIQISK